MKKIGFIGASNRVGAFVKILKERFSDTHTFAGVMDCDPGKMKGFCEIHGLDIPHFTDFDALCDEVKPDILLITTVDSTHCDYVVKALDRKISCVVEKPLCISLEQCRQIAAARARNPEVFAVTSHNARYYPALQKMKAMIDGGEIGKILRIEYTDMLDREHGKSYFRRWNSRRKFSNGLQLHKSCHHFDRMNYLLNSHAVSVTADGSRTAAVGCGTADSWRAGGKWDIGKHRGSGCVGYQADEYVVRQPLSCNAGGYRPAGIQSECHESGYPKNGRIPKRLSGRQFYHMAGSSGLYTL